MAFNPFVSFRRYQKAIFATMAIVCMVLFVLSSGVGGTDLLHQFTDWFSRGRGGKDEVAATIDGKNIGQDVVANVMQHRKLADTYMLIVSEQAGREVFDKVRRERDKCEPALQKALDNFSMYQFLRGQYPADQLIVFISNLHQELRQVQFTLNLGAAPNKDEQMRNAGLLMALVEREHLRLQKIRVQGRDSYFTANLDKTEDALDFMLWKKQADKLGISMQPEDVKNAVANETMGQVFSGETNNYINKFLAEKIRGYSLDMLNNSLVDEFRVRAAKRTLLGGAASPDAATPDELFDWYKDVRTTIKVGLIEVPVAKFVDKVTEEPTDAQLKELFDRHKNDEYDPRFERPGFKETRKVKIDWLAIPGDAPFYAKVSELAPVFSALGQFGTPAITGDGGPAFGFSNVLAARQAIVDLDHERLYREYVNALPSWFDRDAFGMRSGVHDSSVLRPENIAILVGSAVANGATDAGPLTAPLALESRVIVREFRDRARVGASLILGAALEPAPLGFHAITSELIPPPPTEAVIKGMLAGRQRERLIEGLMTSDREWFATELAKRTKEQDRNNVEAFINEFIHSRQLRRGGTAEAVDRFVLTDDPGVAEIKTAFLKTGKKDPTGEAFAGELADGVTRDKPALFHVLQLKGQPVTYMHWRTEDRDPRSVSFEQAKSKVDAAWRFEKARGLAKAEADRLAIEARNKTERELRDLAAKSSARGLIELPSMARLNPSPSFAVGGSPRYEAATIPNDKVKYAGDLVSKVIELRKDMAGATVVSPDFPKANYYVAALMSKEEPTADAFRMAYKASMGPANFRDMLFDFYRNDRTDQFRKDFTKQLRSEANLKILKVDKKSDDEGG